MNKHPKVLIVSGSPFDDNRGDSSTLSNIFKNYDPEKLAQIYFETVNPNTNNCHLFFQISEYLMLKKLLCWKTVVGRSIESRDVERPIINSEIEEKKSSAIFSFVRSHRSIVFSFLREILWGFGFWKNNRLISFIVDFNPDVIWCESYPLVFMHRLNLYVSRVAKKPSVIFLQDDVYTYKSCNNVFQLFYRWRLRRVVKEDILNCKGHFVESPLMKKEYDQFFGINSVFITKGIEINSMKSIDTHFNNPLKLVYLGNVIYGRMSTILGISSAVSMINQDEELVHFDIYTSNHISKSQAERLGEARGVVIHNAVPYDEVESVISKNDVVVLVESFDIKYKNVARLSFSTKITDYLQAGKCILAVGPDSVASYNYLDSQNAALVIYHRDELLCGLKRLLSRDTLHKYAISARDCAIMNHSKTIIDSRVFNELTRVAHIKMCV